MIVSPMRFMANNRNVLRDAVLQASSVLAVANKVSRIETARKGRAQVTLTGTYTGAEQADYDIEILDNDVDVTRISVPTFQGVGSGKIKNITTSGVPQSYVVELNNAGNPATYAEIDVEGQKVRARVVGDEGNAINITVDPDLSFTDTPYSLLVDLQAGNGGVGAPFVGAGFDWDSKPLDNDGLIPTSAHRIAFADDLQTVYLSYKQFKDGQWLYHLVPGLNRDVARGTAVLFVSGGYDIAITDGVSSESYADIITVYDFFNALRTLSALVTVEGVVAYDRTPTGQASRELSLRTSAHAEASTGSGSKYATGFSNIRVDPAASTELITAECFAVAPTDHPLAHLGHTLWQLRGSLSGNLGVIAEGEAFDAPGSPSVFGLTIPQKFPPGYGAVKGTFSVEGIDFVPRADGDPDPPPVCMVLAPLGPAAVDQEIVLKYTRRPSGECGCEDIPEPIFNAECLGLQGTDDGGNMTYRAETIARVVDLRQWYADIVRANTSHGSGQGDYDQAPLFTKPVTRRALGSIVDQRVVQYDEVGTLTGTNDGWAPNDVISGRSVYNDSGNTMFDGHPTYDVRRLLSYTPFDTVPLEDMCNRFERALAEIDPLPAGALRDAGEAAWDTALVELKADIEAQLMPSDPIYSLFGVSVDPEVGLSVPESTTLSAGDVVLVYRQPGTDDTLLARKWVPGTPGAKGFITASADTAGNVTVYFAGVNASGNAESNPYEIGKNYAASRITSGYYDILPALAPGDPPQVDRIGVAVSIDEMQHDVTLSGLTVAYGTSNRLAILADRYRARLEWVSISAGVSHLGKSSASILESGDGCWRDWGDALYWTVIGSEGGEYAPAFTNHVYYSSRRATRRDRYYSTNEFGFQISIKCPERLKEGDTITLRIGNSSWGVTYSVGDMLELPIVAAGPLYLSGGRDANNIQTWNPSGSDHGPFPAFDFDLDAPAPYSVSGLAFELEPGGIPFAKGDRFRFAAEGGHYRWRKDGGAWEEPSPPAAIPDGPVLIDEGLYAEFFTGAGRSFVAGDVYSFRALQPWAVSQVQTPRAVRRQWKWSGTTATLDVEFDDVERVEMTALLCSLPDGVSVLLEGGVDSDGFIWSEVLTYADGQIWKAFEGDAGHDARFVRYTFTDAAGGSVQFAWLGVPIQTPRPADWNPSRMYNMTRSRGLQSGRFTGKGTGGEVAWAEGAMTEADATAFETMLDYVKERNDEPIIFVPQVTRSTEPFVYGLIGSDDVEFKDVHGYQVDVSRQRKISARIPITPVWHQ